MIRGGRLGGTCFRVILCACFEGGVLTFFFFFSSFSCASCCSLRLPHHLTGYLTLLFFFSLLSSCLSKDASLFSVMFSVYTYLPTHLVPAPDCTGT